MKLIARYALGSSSVMNAVIFRSVKQKSLTDGYGKATDKEVNDPKGE